ncbi:MAG: hypothetical protein FWE31_01425 [Firmicutes bacterium]|nr:hypothetical protein [Bacillota bacterium]
MEPFDSIAEFVEDLADELKSNLKQFANTLKKYDTSMLYGDLHVSPGTSVKISSYESGRREEKTEVIPERAYFAIKQLKSTPSKYRIVPDGNLSWVTTAFLNDQVTCEMDNDGEISLAGANEVHHHRGYDNEILGSYNKQQLSRNGFPEKMNYKQIEKLQTIIRERIRDIDPQVALHGIDEILKEEAFKMSPETYNEKMR